MAVSMHRHRRAKTSGLVVWSHEDSRSCDSGTMMSSRTWMACCSESPRSWIGEHPSAAPLTPALSHKGRGRYSADFRMQPCLLSVHAFVLALFLATPALAQSRVVPQGREQVQFSFARIVK